VEVIAEACKMKCIRSTKAMWTQISADTIVVTHPTKDTEVVCEDQPPVNLASPTVGSLQIGFSCGCALFMQNRLIWQPDDNICESHKKTVFAHVILPVQWTHLTNFVPFDSEGKGGDGFNDEKSVVNFQWGERFENKDDSYVDVNINVISCLWNLMQTLAIMYFFCKFHLGGLVGAGVVAQANALQTDCVRTDEAKYFFFALVVVILLGWLPKTIYDVCCFIKSTWWKAVDSAAIQKIDAVDLY